MGLGAIAFSVFAVAGATIRWAASVQSAGYHFTALSVILVVIGVVGIVDVIVEILLTRINSRRELRSIDHRAQDSERASASAGGSVN